MTLITRHTGEERPQRAAYTIELGLRRYTVAFDIQERENAEGGRYEWKEAVMPRGLPTYEQLVSAFIRGRYSDDQMQALVNNYLLDGEKYLDEWNAMQEWRRQSKLAAKELAAELAEQY